MPVGPLTVDLGAADLAVLPTEQPPRELGADARYPLVLACPKPHAFMNSQYGNMAKQLQQHGEQGCSIHIGDASARSIATGDAVRVFNDRDEILATAMVADDVAAGVVLSPMGQRPDRVDGGFGVNALTSTRYADIGQAPTFSDTAVQVERLSK